MRDPEGQLKWDERLAMALRAIDDLLVHAGEDTKHMLFKLRSMTAAYDPADKDGLFRPLELEMRIQLVKCMGGLNLKNNDISNKADVMIRNMIFNFK